MHLEQERPIHNSASILSIAISPPEEDLPYGTAVASPLDVPTRHILGYSPERPIDVVRVMMHLCL